ncbi:insulinase family protein [Oxynema sp. CENA135]|uniref:M16 family metallopeptidase n=1 Tax=Oxynema sp. CENA135 TaxID=984206 RepID=UPI00190C0CF8|nr:insulinase family protein [Oxynema sp. CENA135]
MTQILKSFSRLCAADVARQTSPNFGEKCQFWPRLFTSILACLFLWVQWPAAPALARSMPDPSNSPGSIQPYLQSAIDRVSEFTLDNGLKFIVLEQHEAPVVSFLTYADVGGANEPEGNTGVAHFLEHLAFKGTPRIGTKNYQKERQLFAQLDRLNAEIKAAADTGNTENVTKLQEKFAKIQNEAAELVVQNEFGQIVQKSGGVGLNASTSADATRYFYSFPSNKLELWMSLESERFLEPVFREFYKEKQVILEERRLRTDNSPIGQTIEAFLDTAYQVHPYRRPVIGYPQDLQNMTREDVRQFFERYYVPNNLTVAIVGDVDPAQVRELAQIYFGRYPSKPAPPKVEAVEPVQTEPREVTLRLPSQPWYLEGYHRPPMNHPDRAVYELITSILSDGRTSRLYRSLVEDRQLALNAQGFNGFPGNKYPNLMLFYALTAPGHTVEEVARALHEQIERLTVEPVSEQELERVKTQARAQLLRSLDSNSGMASLLVEYEVKTGSWRNLFQEIEAFAAVTSEDVLRVARETFRPENRTVGRLLPEEES